MKRLRLQEVRFECHEALTQVLKSKAVALTCLISQEVQTAYCNFLSDPYQCQDEYDHLQIHNISATASPTPTVSRSVNVYLRRIAAAIQTVPSFFSEV